jgi:plastocyanin
VLAVPVGAQAATKDVNAGAPAGAQKTLDQYGALVNAFFPQTVSVHVGDKVRFTPNGFHNVDLLPKGGGTGVPLLSPTGTTANPLDAAGAPYWFNGQPNMGFTSSLLTSSFGKTVTYTGAKAVNSGLPLGPPKPFTVKFTKTGTYTYLCDIHAGMKATVKVLPKSKSVPTAKADAARVKTQIATAVKTAKALTKVTQPANTVDLGVAGLHGVELFVFAPANLTVPTGTTVNFAMTKNSFEVHTATTGPGTPQQADSFLGKLFASVETPVFDPQVVYPSDPPGTPAALTPASHGNGFWNSGVLDAVSASPLPGSNSVTFASPGTYTFYCAIHPFMKGTVTVT